MAVRVFNKTMWWLQVRRSGFAIIHLIGDHSWHFMNYFSPIYYTHGADSTFTRKTICSMQISNGVLTIKWSDLIATQFLPQPLLTLRFAWFDEDAKTPLDAQRQLYSLISPHTMGWSHTPHTTRLYHLLRTMAAHRIQINFRILMKRRQRSIRMLWGCQRSIRRRLLDVRLCNYALKQPGVPLQSNIVDLIHTYLSRSAQPALNNYFPRRLPIAPTPTDM